LCYVVFNVQLMKPQWSRRYESVFMGLTNSMKLIRACMSKSKIPLLGTRCQLSSCHACFVFGRPKVPISTLRVVILTAIFCDFLRCSCRSWYRTANYVTAFQIHYSLSYHLVLRNGYWSCPLLNKLSTMSWRCVGEWGYDSTILDLSPGYRWPVGLMSSHITSWIGG
jgi:hypothetical protein